MNSRFWLGTSTLIASLAMLDGCGGTSSMPTTPAAVTAANPAVGSGKERLLYVSDTVTGDVYVFAYPGAHRHRAQTLFGFTDPAGECVDKQGDVFITNTGASNIIEYPYGGSKPIATLDDAGFFPIGCAVDPTTGNLAVSNFSTSGSAPGNIVIYKGAKGNPTGNYGSSQMTEMLLCSYDNAGNFFVDGLGAGSAFELAELPKGGKKLVNLTVNQTIDNAGGVQWDGKYLAIGDQTTNVIYRFAISGSTGKEVSATTLADASDVFQFLIVGNRLLGADAGSGDVGVWHLSSGAQARKPIGQLYAPLGVALSDGG
jgi:hypothetical protein